MTDPQQTINQLTVIRDNVVAKLVDADAENERLQKKLEILGKTINRLLEENTDLRGQLAAIHGQQVWYRRRVAALEKLYAYFRASSRPTEKLFDELALTANYVAHDGEWVPGAKP